MRVIISGGGTGGHIFPAISIAKKIEKIMPMAEILFVGADGRMEMEKVPAAGYKIIGLPVTGMKRGFNLKNISVLLKLFRSLKMAKKIISNFKPDVVVGVGGYASGPILYQATKMGIPTVIQEQNSFAGLTNKILSKKVNKICVAYDGMEKYFPENKIVKTGNPIREEIIKLAHTRMDGIEKFNLNPNLKTVLVIGGSLGARTINLSVSNSLNMLNQYNIQIIWQTGKNYFNTAKMQSLGYKNVRVHEFIYEMDLAYATADLIISRAGAITISELCQLGKPAILIPSPNVAEDHQTKNAMALVQVDAAVMMTDDEAIGSLMVTALDILEDEKKMATLSKNIKKLAIPNATELIVKEVLSIVKKTELHTS
jgi:UDP-N-acetylglucosamine--N-acetylmuramyl-(pentapeptide) pyrophosphoryl-undecaprenol N-acetylglucosamine transferase